MILPVLLFLLYFSRINCSINICENDSFENRRKYFNWPVSEDCLQCIWEFSGSKKRTEESGPFSITKFYWMDGNNVTINNMDPKDENAYKKCVQNFYCSMVTMQNYMNRYKQFCRAKELTCYHFLKMHINGGAACNKEWKVTINNKNCNFTGGMKTIQGVV